MAKDSNTSKVRGSTSKKRGHPKAKASNDADPTHDRSEFDPDLVNTSIDDVLNQLHSLLDIQQQLRMRKEELEVAVQTEWEAEQKLFEAEQNLEDAKQVTMEATNNMRDAEAEFWERQGQITLPSTSTPRVNGSADRVTKKSAKRKTSDCGSDKARPRKKTKTSSKSGGHTSGSRKSPI